MVVIQLRTSILLLVFGLIILSSCSKDEENCKIGENIPVLFQYEQINFAWEYSHSGWFIDNYGNIRGFNLPQSWSWPDSLGYISGKELIQNLYQTDTTYLTIDITELNEKAAMITGTINGAISDSINPKADAGLYSIYCFYWDSEKNMYKRQVLKTVGDIEFYNKESEAIELSDWLIEIGNRFHQCFMWSCED